MKKKPSFRSILNVNSASLLSPITTLDARNMNMACVSLRFGSLCLCFLQGVHSTPLPLFLCLSAYPVLWRLLAHRFLSVFHFPIGLVLHLPRHKRASRRADLVSQHKPTRAVTDPVKQVHHLGLFRVFPIRQLQ